MDSPNAFHRIHIRRWLLLSPMVFLAEGGFLFLYGEIGFSIIRLLLTGISALLFAEAYIWCWEEFELIPRTPLQNGKHWWKGFLKGKWLGDNGLPAKMNALMGFFKVIVLLLLPPIFSIWTLGIFPLVLLISRIHNYYKTLEQ